MQSYLRAHAKPVTGICSHAMTRPGLRHASQQARYRDARRSAPISSGRGRSFRRSSRRSGAGSWRRRGRTSRRASGGPFFMIRSWIGSSGSSPCPIRRSSRTKPTSARRSRITEAAKSAFLSGDQSAYVAGIVAILLGAALVFLLFPKKDDEGRLLAAYHSEDAARQMPPGKQLARIAASRRPA